MRVGWAHVPGGRSAAAAGGRLPMRRRASLLSACAGLLALAACAPRPARLVPVDAGGTREVYLSRLAARERLARMAVGEATLWPRGPAACDTCAPARLPAVQADLAMLAPESLRLRVRSAFGTAVDLALRGDSLVAYAPGLGLAVALDAVRDSFGPAGPGRLAARVLSAAWRPAPGAPVVWRDGALEWLWREDGDSLAVAPDGDGLPARVRLWRGEGPGARVRYTRWEEREGVAWPMAWSLESGGGGPGLDGRVDRVSFAARPDPARLVVRIPEGVEPVGADGLRRLLAAAGLWR